MSYSTDRRDGALRDLVIFSRSGQSARSRTVYLARYGRIISNYNTQIVANYRFKFQAVVPCSLCDFVNSFAALET